MTRHLLIVLALAVPAACLGQKDEPELKLSKEEQAVLDLTNAARAKEKLPPLRPSATLSKVALGHSANMAGQRKLDHTLDGKDPLQRLQDVGLKPPLQGENIVAGSGLTPEGALEVWMNSEAHRGNILSPKFEEIGIGVAKDGGGTVYYTQVFTGAGDK